MGVRCLGVMLCGLFGLAGCQTGGNTELMERELRLQEDRIYELEDELERHCKMLETCRRENAALKAARPAGSTRGASNRGAGLDEEPQKPSVGTPPPVSDDDLTPPKVEIDLPPEPPADSSGDSLPSLRTPQLNAPNRSGGELPTSSVDNDPGSAQMQQPLRIRINAGDEVRMPEARLAKQPAATARDKSASGEANRTGSRTAPTPAPVERPRWSPYR